MSEPPASSATVPEGAVRSYHGQPVIKQPVWTWEIPTYFFTGGLGGASAGLAYLSELRGNDVLGRRAWGTALVAVGVSPVLLTSDLGKPLRFPNMLRMFKVTSPMSVGSWLLSGSGAATAVATANAWTGLLPTAGRAARPAAALLGLPLSTYTAALIANTAVPVWNDARSTLPFVFASGAALSAGALAVATTPVSHAGPARRLALGGAAIELGLNEVMKKRLGDLAEPYEHGASRKFTQLSRAFILGGSAVLAGGRKSRVAAAASAGLLSAGALCARWSIFKAGLQSAADPGQVIGPQRAAIERRERTGAARAIPRVSEPDPSIGSPANSQSTMR